MPKPLADEAAIRICRSHQPSGPDLVRVVRWAQASPSADKVAPLLVLFTKAWALQEYPRAQAELCQAVAACALDGDQAVWDCLERDYDGSRVYCAGLVSLHARDVAQRLPRLLELVRNGRLGGLKEEAIRIAAYHGVPVPDEVRRAPDRQVLGTYFEECRAAWPSERDRMPLLEQVNTARVIDDEAARALCRKYEPTPAEIRSVLDWAVARPSPDTLRWLVILATGHQLGNQAQRWYDVAAGLAVAQGAEALWEVLEGDWEPERLFAAGYLCSGLDGKAPIERLMQIFAGCEAMPPSLGPVVREAAARRGCREPEAFRVAMGDAGNRQTQGEEFQRRRAAWPANRDRLPRPVRAYHVESGGRPELAYSTEPTELTQSLNRIRAWLNGSQQRYPVTFAPGLTQEEIARQARSLPVVLTAELCELYRWANGADGNGFLIYFDLFKPLAEAIEQDYLMMCALSSREDAVVWRPEWFPIFNESHDWWIQSLPVHAAATAPMIHFYLAGGTPRTRYRSLTEMMAVWADSYEGGAFSLNAEGFLHQDLGRFAAIEAACLKSRRAR